MINYSYSTASTLQESPCFIFFGDFKGWMGSPEDFLRSPLWLFLLLIGYPVVCEVFMSSMRTRPKETCSRSQAKLTRPAKATLQSNKPRLNVSFHLFLQSLGNNNSYFQKCMFYSSTAACSSLHRRSPKGLKSYSSLLLLNICPEAMHIQSAYLNLLVFIREGRINIKVLTRDKGLIRPSIFFHLSGVELQWQQVYQGAPDALGGS